MEEQSVHGRIGDINSAETVKTLTIPRKKRICLVGTACDDPALNVAAQQFKVSVLKSETGTEYIGDLTYHTYFVLKQFEGSIYDALKKITTSSKSASSKSASNKSVLSKSSSSEINYEHRMLGPTALLQLAEKKESLPDITRPMYTQAMVGTQVVLGGFSKLGNRKKEVVGKLADMINNMGGSIRKEIDGRVTHLIAKLYCGKKYRAADTYGIPVMSVKWVIALWNAKDDVSSHANSEELIATYKVKPLHGAKVCFYGFPEEEKKHMCEILEQQGGEANDEIDLNCTHVVVDVPGSLYRKFNDAKLHALENSSKHNPLSLMYFKPISSSSCYPNLNAISDRTKAITCDNSNISSIDSTNSIKTQDNYSSSKNMSCISQTFDIEHNTWSDLISNNVSKDSAVSVTDNSSNLQNSMINPSLTFYSLVEQNDSGVDIIRSSNLSDTFLSDKSSIPITSTLISKKNMKSNHSESSLFNNECEIMSILSAQSGDVKLSREKNNTHSVCASPKSNNALSLKYRKNIHYIQNNTSMTKITPKRYVKWRKTYSCTSVHKMAKLEKCKFMKTRSYPNILRHCEEQYSDTFLYNILNKRSKHLSKSHTSILSKISQFSFCSTFSENEQDTSMNSYYSPPEKTLFKKKYTSLSKSFPTTPTKISNTKHSLRTTFTSNGKQCNVSSTSHDMRNDCTDLKTQEDKPLFVVVDESNITVSSNLGDIDKDRVFIVKTGWFWTSVQNEVAADENEHPFESSETVSSPGTASSRRNSQQIVTLPKHQCWSGSPLPNLLRNGVDSPASVSGSFLDCTASPEKQLLDDIPDVEPVATESVRENLSQRHQVFLELVETEANYVDILNTIITLFKEPLEKLIDNRNGKELLNTTEVKTIFGNFEPIHDVHKKLLEALRYSAAHWTEDISIGNIFLKFGPDLVKAYKPYFNFYERTKQMLEECDQNKPRFHAFLKNCQTIPKCGRQSLIELYIQPVQRLPRIRMLLERIHKYTDENNPDYGALKASASCIDKDITSLNADKGKTERQVAMFDIFNEIDNCPADLISSHRLYISKCDVMEVLTGTESGLSGRNDHLVLFLFTDTLEICKKRSKAFNSLKSPNTINGLQSSKLSQGKPYKHITMLPLNTIRKVVDIRETAECHKVFTLVVRGAKELKEKLLSFVIIDEVDKTSYLQTLCMQIALVGRIADADTLLIRYDSHQLEVGTNDVASGTLKKTIKFASRARTRVGRAFSFNKTPSKLNRAMSTFKSPFGTTHNLAPTNQQIAQMRLGSCNNISELDNGGSSSPNRDDVLVAPMSDQPTRKALSMASLRRL